MSNQELLEASKNGDTDLIRRLLHNQKLDINCKNI